MQVEQRRDMERFRMKISKYFVVFFSFFVLTSVQAMERSGSGELGAAQDLEAEILGTDADPRSMEEGLALDGRIQAAIQGRNIKDLGTLLRQLRTDTLAEVSRGGKRRSHKKKQQKVSAAFKGAQGAAERNVQAAENNLGIWRNTGRRNQVIGGLAAILLGLAKGVYDTIQFWDEDTKTGGNVFSLVSDGSLVVVGGYGLRLAWENGPAKSEFNQALAIQYIVQQTAQLEAPKKSKS